MTAPGSAAVRFVRQQEKTLEMLFSSSPPLYSWAAPMGRSSNQLGQLLLRNYSGISWFSCLSFQTPPCLSSVSIGQQRILGGSSVVVIRLLLTVNLRTDRQQPSSTPTLAFGQTLLSVSRGGWFNYRSTRLPLPSATVESASSLCCRFFTFWSKLSPSAARTAKILLKL